MKEATIDFAFFKDGNCIGIATKFSGPGSRFTNTATLSNYRGYKVREMPRNEACAAHKAYLDTLAGFWEAKQLELPFMLAA